jgi:hypothetical protein
MNKFIFSVWNPSTGTRRQIVEGDSYDQVVNLYTTCLPPSYIWGMEPIFD